MAIAINRIRPDEWALLRDLRLASLRDSPEAFGQRLDDAALFDDDDWMSTARAASSGERRIWFIARDDAQPVGLVQARRRPPDACLLFSMWVAPEARRLGVGRALVDAVTDWARDWGAKRVILWVLAGNEGAHRFYEDIGFQVLTSGPDAASGNVYGALAMERLTARQRIRASPG
jgi:GNAT superfamily N-acetyltransferase